MKKPDWRKLAPVGVDASRREGPAIGYGLLVAGAFSAPIPYACWEERQRILDLLHRGFAPQDVTVRPFSLIAEYGFEMFGVFFLAMLLLGVGHHLLHRKSSMSVYLMRRLPDRWEYLRRCWSIPLLAIAAGAVEMLLLRVVYYAVYLLLTSQAFLPPVYLS